MDDGWCIAFNTLLQWEKGAGIEVVILHILSSAHFSALYDRGIMCWVIEEQFVGARKQNKRCGR